MHQEFITDCLKSGTETIKKRDDLSIGQILSLRDLEAMSSFKRDDLPGKEAYEEFRGYSCAYWLARAKGHENVAESVVQTWSADIQHSHRKNITHLDEMQRVLDNLASAGDIRHLQLLWPFAKEKISAEEEINFARASVVRNACEAGKMNVIHYLLNIPEEKTGLSNFLSQNQHNYFRFMYLACKSGDKKTIEWVVDFAKESKESIDANQLFECTLGYHPLAEACGSGNLDAVRYVLNQIPEQNRQRAITQASECLDVEYPNYAIEQACFSRNPQILNALLEVLNEEQVTAIFSPHYQPADHHPLNYAQGVAMTDTIFNNMTNDWAETIIGSEVYRGALSEAYRRNELEQASYLLDKVSDEKLESVLDSLNSHLDRLVLSDDYSIDQRDKKMFTAKIDEYKHLRNQLDPTQPSLKNQQTEDLRSKNLAQSRLFRQTSQEEESTLENLKHTLSIAGASK